MADLRDMPAAVTAYDGHGAPQGDPTPAPLDPDPTLPTEPAPRPTPPGRPTRRRDVKGPRPVEFPCVVIADTREQHPYAFATITADRRQGGGPLLVQVRRGTLPTGDYSLEGHTADIAVERKSLNDLYHTLGQGRERFERELARLNAMKSARVIIEAEWTEIINSPPGHSKLKPKTVYRSILAWMERFPRVHWLPVPGRAFAEVTTLRVLERFLREQEREKAESKPRGKR